MKRTLELMVLGIIGLLLSTASAFTPVPIVGPDAPGMRQPHPLPAAAADKPGEGLVLTASPSPSLSRVDHPLHHGISVESLNLANFESSRLALAAVSADTAHELGFDSLRRAPPSCPQI